MIPDSSKWFLGKVEFDPTKEGFTRLRPLARATEDRLYWEELNAVATFPARGRVCWFNAPAEVREQSLVEFQVAESIGFDSISRPERYHVIHARLAVEVIEISSLDEDVLRDALTDSGLKLLQTPAGLTLFSIGAGRYVGPFDLVAHEADNWKLSTAVELEAVPLFDALSISANEVCVDGLRRRVLVMAGEPLAATRVVNWQSEVDVLRGLLRRLRKLDRDAFDSIGLTYAAFDAYVEAVKKVGSLPTQQFVREVARAERVKKLRQDLPIAAELATEIVESLETFGAVRERIKQRLEEVIGEQKARIETQISDGRHLLRQVQHEVAETRRENEKLAMELNARREAVNADLFAIDAALQERVSQIRETPAKAIVDIMVTSAVYSALSSTSSKISSNRSVSLPVLPSELANDVSVVSARLAGEMLCEGIDPSLSGPLVATFAAGMVPVCSGDGALAALNALGKSLCGGNSWTLPLSPATTSLTDVLTHSSSSVAGLLDIIEVARRNQDDLFLVIIKNADLGASEGYLLSLLELAECSSRREKTRIPLICSKTGEQRDWPTNLLLALAVSGARLALPLPIKLWEAAPLIHFDWVIDSSNFEQTQMPSRLANSDWREFCSYAQSSAKNASFTELGSMPSRRLANRFYNALLALGVDAAAADVLARTHVVAPAMAAEERELPSNFPTTAAFYFKIASAMISEK